MPNLFAPSIFLDTSVVRGTKADNAPFQLLVSLASAGLLKIFFPEIVKDEFRTQWRDTNETNISQALKALTHIKDEHFLSTGARQKALELIQALEGVDIEQESSIFLEEFVSANKIEIHPLNQTQAEAAWKSYFSGKLPSKKIKNRSDIPDAHVIASVLDFAKNAVSTYFVSQDKTLLEAVQTHPDINCFSSIDDLLKSKELLELRAVWEEEKKWQAAKHAIDYDEIEEKVRSFVQENGGELLSWQEVRGQSIPEDNHTANIEMYGEPEEIELSDAEDWGGGLLRYQASYLSECLLGFKVFRSDAFDVPDWVSVSYGDPELDHYFDAEAEVVVRVEVDVNVKINIDESAPQISTKIGDISFEESSLQLELTMDEE